MEDYSLVLRELDFSSGEIRIYLILLQKGPLTATQISKETGLNRSNLYRILEKLIERKLVFSSLIENVKYFSFTRPERIKELYESKLASLESQKIKVDSFIDVIEKFSRLNMPDDKFIVEVHEGVEEIKKILSDVLTLNKNETIYEFGKEKALLDYPGVKYWIDSLFKKRAEKGIKFMAVYNLHSQARKSNSKNTSIRYIKLEGIGETAIALYRNTVLFYIMTAEKPKVILIRNKNIFDAFLGYFKFLWETGKEM